MCVHHRILPFLACTTILSAGVITRSSATLRSGGCDADAPAIAELAAGTAVSVRSSIAGSGEVCYRVTALVEGKSITGNLPGSVLDGLAEFDQARQSASGGGEAVQVTTAAQVESLRKSLGSTQASNATQGIMPPGPLRQASDLLDRNQPGRALEVLSPHLKSRDPSVLILAGVAAWKADQAPVALEHWKAAQEIRPMPELQSMIGLL